jgi:hypothetical protein
MENEQNEWTRYGNECKEQLPTASIDIVQLTRWSHQYSPRLARPLLDRASKVAFTQSAGPFGWFSDAIGLPLPTFIDTFHSFQPEHQLASR